MKKYFLALLLVFVCSVRTVEAVDMFLKLEPDVKGESTDTTHKEEIDVLAWAWGVSNSGTTHLGGGSGAGKVNFQDLNFTKYVDASSTELLKGVSTGKHYPKATLVVRKAGTTPVEFLKIIMEEVLVTSISTGGSAGESRLTENVSLNFAKVTVEYIRVDSKGKPDSTPKRFVFNIVGNIAE